MLLVISSMSRRAWWFPYICIFRWLEATSSWAVGTCTGNMRIIMYVFLCAICVCGLYNLKRDDMNHMYSCRNADSPVGLFFADEDLLCWWSWQCSKLCFLGHVQKNATRCMIVAPSCGRCFFKKVTWTIGKNLKFGKRGHVTWNILDLLVNP